MNATKEQLIRLDYLNCITESGWKMIESKRTVEQRNKIQSNWVESFNKAIESKIKR